jgi:hypothetical protein
VTGSTSSPWAFHFKFAGWQIEIDKTPALKQWYRKNGYSNAGQLHLWFDSN